MVAGDILHYIDCIGFGREKLDTQWTPDNWKGWAVTQIGILAVVVCVTWLLG